MLTVEREEESGKRGVGRGEWEEGIGSGEGSGKC